MDNLLKLTKPMMHGPAVKRLQEIGDMIGFDNGPNDGIFGPKTRNVVIRIQEKFGLTRDGICGPRTWRKIIEYVDKLAGAGRHEDDQVNRIHDIRGEHQRPRLYSHQRGWPEINGVTLHQTGCEMPQHPNGWGRVNAHIGITQEGRTILINEFTDMIWHAQGLSKTTIGIEIEGNFPGVRGDMRTLWKGGGGPHFFNIAMKMALDECFELLCTEFDRNNAAWESVHAHRQSSRSRRADPGSEIWQTIAMPWGKRLGLEQADGGPDWHLPKGMAIPKRWNPAYPGNY